MIIGLVNENSQADKNGIIFNELNKVATAHGHEVLNFGMYSSKDERYLTYVMNGLLISLLLNAKVVDFVVTGCGTGQGATISSNAFPGVQCGHIAHSMDAFLFTQINAGNCISLPFAQGYGWGGEINLRYTFEKLFEKPFGCGYPPEKVEVEQKNKKIMDQVKDCCARDIIEVMDKLGADFVKKTIDDPKFAELFYPRCKDQRIADYLKAL